MGESINLCLNSFFFVTSVENLQLLATLLEIFHISLILFILSGWVFPCLRPAHLVVVAMTGLSWLIFGKMSMFGECIITEWHWQVLSKLGETNLPETYAQYLFTRITGIPVVQGVALAVTRVAWLLIFILSLLLVTRPLLRREISLNIFRRLKS